MMSMKHDSDFQLRVGVPSSVPHSECGVSGHMFIEETITWYPIIHARAMKRTKTRAGLRAG